MLIICHSMCFTKHELDTSNTKYTAKHRTWFVSVEHCVGLPALKSASSYKQQCSMIDMQ